VIIITDNKGKDNANYIETEIRNLRSIHNDIFGCNNKEFWRKVKHINGLFSSLKPLSKDCRINLWNEFSSLCEDRKVVQRREKETFLEYSRQKRSLVEDKIDEAHYYAMGSKDVDDLKNAKQCLHVASQRIKNGWDGFNFIDGFVEDLLGNRGRMTKEDREACWERWKEVNEEIKYKREELWKVNYNRFRERVYDASNMAHYGNPYDAVQKIKYIQVDLKSTQMSKAYRDDLRDSLNSSWERAQSRISDLKEEKRLKHERWLDRMYENIDRWTSLMEKNEGVIDRLEQLIDEDEDRIANARSDDFACTVQGWIDEKQQKIRDIMETNRSLEEKIDSFKRKIND
jgi:hypothetical protein